MDRRALAGGFSVTGVDDDRAGGEQVPDREPADELDRWPTATSRDALAWEMAQHYGDDQELLRDLVSAVLEIRSLRARLGDTEPAEVEYGGRHVGWSQIKPLDRAYLAAAKANPNYQLFEHDVWVGPWRSVDGSGDPK